MLKFLKEQPCLFIFPFLAAEFLDAFSLCFPTESPSHVQAQTALEALKCSFTLAVFPQKGNQFWG